MEAEEVRALITDGLEGRRTVDQIVEVLLDEMAKGGRIFVVDENLLDLDNALSELRYTTYTVPLKEDDNRIKENLGGRVLVTHNGRHFSDPTDMKRYNYGLIWVVSQGDAQVLAELTQAAIRRVNFRRNLVQVVKI